MVTLDPRPISLEAAIRPRCSSTICREMARPRPVPLALVVKYGSKIRSTSSMPGPWSRTEITTSGPAARPGHDLARPALHGLERVVDHVQEHALELLGVGLHAGRSAAELQRDGDALRGPRCA